MEDDGSGHCLSNFKLMQGGAARLICTVVDCVPLDFTALDWALMHVVRTDRDELHIVSGLGPRAPVRQAMLLTRQSC